MNTVYSNVKSDFPTAVLHNIKTSMYVLLLVSNFSQEDNISHKVACENIHKIKIQIIARTDLKPDIDNI